MDFKLEEEEEGKKMKKPTIIINFKTYKQGKKAVKLAKEIEKIGQRKGLGILHRRIRRYWFKL